MTACNAGDANLPGEGVGTNQHPIQANHVYQLTTSPIERFQQIGIAWLKHDDWAFCQNDCQTCNVEACEESSVPGLYPGCSDTYTVSVQATGPLGPRSSVNALTGSFNGGHYFSAAGCDGDCCPPSTASNPFPGYLHVKASELVCPPTTSQSYFLEGQFVTPGETGDARFNNVSYAPIAAKWVNRTSLADCTSNCSDSTNCTWWMDSGNPASATVQEQPAIHAWKAANSNVVETVIDVPDEGRFILAALATKLVPSCSSECWYSYEYALYNMNSDRSAGGFRVRLPDDLQAGDIDTTTDPPFHDIDYHDGDGYSCPNCRCSNNTLTECNTDADCDSPGVCKQHCKGGSNAEGLCLDDADCPGGGACRAHCSGGSNDDEICGSDADCPGGSCLGRLNFDGTDWPPDLENLV